MRQHHIVRTCRVVNDVQPSWLPSIPKGAFGICFPDREGGGDYDPTDFGPPWGIQRVGNHDLVDAGAVLANARMAITEKKRPWRNVIRRVLRGFAGHYLITAVAEQKVCGDEEGSPGGASWPVEAYLHRHGSKKVALQLLTRARELAGDVRGAKPYQDPWDFARTAKAREARRQARMAERGTMKSQSKPERVKARLLWRHGKEYVFVDRVLKPAGELPWAEFTDGGQAFLFEMLHDAAWEYLGHGPDPERDLEDPPREDVKPRLRRAPRRKPEEAAGS